MFRLLLLIFINISLIFSLPAHSQESQQKCPQDLENLTSLLIPQIPSYANRVIQRGRRLERGYDLFSYVVVAGKPDFKPLTLINREYETLFSDSTEQVFFTTLERRYINNQPRESQNYHWIFLVHTQNGWRLVSAFTRFGLINTPNVSTPIQETTNSVIGEAIRLWLRDCEFGSLR